MSELDVLDLTHVSSFQLRTYMTPCIYTSRNNIYTQVYIHMHVCMYMPHKKTLQKFPGNAQTNQTSVKSNQQQP